MQCKQVKFRLKNKVKIKASHSVVTVGTVCVSWGVGGGVKNDMDLTSAISLI